MEEEWRKIEGFSDYTVSNLGRVCSTKREQAIILKTRKNNYGYLLVDLYSKNKKHHTVTIHRLVALAFIPNTENKSEVNHINGDKTDNNINNLEWVTDSENMKHAFATGLRSHMGVNNTRTHLTEAQVIEIYMLAHAGSLKQKEIGRRYGISYVTVSFIKTGRTWKALTANTNIQSQKQTQTTFVVG